MYARISLILSILVFSPVAQAQLLPVDIKDVVLYVETAHIDTALHVAHCASDPCRTNPNTESAAIKDQYCDTDYCPDGCVRRWLDQSSYIPTSGFKPPEYTKGRNFGQDDNEKPCFIPNAIHGKPSLKGGPPYGLFKQDKYLELEVPDIIGLANDFSIYLLCKPIDQSATGDWYYFGQASTFLKHKASDNSLRLRPNGSATELKITNSNSIKLDKWQLIEIHRDASNQITCFLNGVDQTAGLISQSGLFRIGYLFSNYKTKGNVAMYGEVASFFIYNRKLNDTERNSVLTYLHDEYLSELPLSIKRAASAPSNQFNVYYHAASAAVQIQGPSEELKKITKIHIYNLDGQTLLSYTPRQNEPVPISIPIPKFNAQIALIRIETPDAIFTRKLYLNTDSY